MITFLMIVNSYFLSNLKKEMFFSVESRSLSFHEHYIRTKMGKTKKDVKHSSLMALLPGANIDNEKGKN
jgi:uncharacterized protein YxjI